MKRAINKYWTRRTIDRMLKSVEHERDLNGDCESICYRCALIDHYKYLVDISSVPSRLRPEKSKDEPKMVKKQSKVLLPGHARF